MSILTSFMQYLACATCMADSGGISQKAANLGIFIMLGVLALVFGCLAATVYSFARRAKRAAKPVA